MKTTDGYEVDKGHYYYLENGQSVILDECVTNQGGKQVFLVTPFYEGETMSVNGDGGTHNEITAQYEHEGEPTLVYSIFVEAPLKKLDIQYKDKLDQIEMMVLSLGEVKKAFNVMSSDKNRIKGEIKELGKSLESSKENDLQARNMLNSTTEEVNKKRQELSEIEDSIPLFKKESDGGILNSEELKRLNKRDFKLTCLEAGGVDNWEWLDESLKDFNERYPEG